ncbi:saccharopine dehydrogenase (NADP+, L-glutamate-forming), partial [Coemansia nantahalensis]
PSLSQDSETAPIGSLPQLSSVRHSSQGFLGRFPAGDRMDAASLGSGGGRWCGSIVDLQRPRQYASSVGGMPAAHGFSQDIWRADLLAVPDPAMRISGGTRTRPRTVICGDSDGGLDPHNPYLGEFLARRQARGSSRASAPAAAAATNILLLGSGFVAEPCLEYLLRSGNNRVTVACRRIEKAEELTAKYANATAVSVDVEDDAALEAAVAAHELVISLIPYTQHAR